MNDWVKRIEELEAALEKIMQRSDEKSDAYYIAKKALKGEGKCQQ